MKRAHAGVVAGLWREAGPHFGDPLGEGEAGAGADGADASEDELLKLGFAIIAGQGEIDELLLPLQHGGCGGVGGLYDLTGCPEP
ncbi:hypothetical protein [Prosthecobacter sp.]|uniref:hypothetical protein n=1 Tax=Prosthecobacter sp. TaxID=1965333 RepID=UPI003783FF40